MRESHPLAPEEPSFTDWRVYFSTVIPDIRAAIYTGEGRQVLDALTFVVVLVYCVSLNDKAPYFDEGVV